jgi:hypothetical protein
VTTRVLIGSFVVAVSLVLSAAAASARAASLPRVTVISDSIMSAVDWNATPTAILEQGIDLQMQVGICRRVEGVSCPFDGGEVPTLVDLVPDLGSSIAQTVIVEVGYNDPADVFPQEVDDAMQVLFRAGVTRVLWVNMREAQGQYPAMNAELLAAAGRYPQLTVIDWNAYSVDHPEWFQTDGMHLLEAGGEGMATLLHNALMQLVLTPPPPLPLYPAPGSSGPAARVACGDLPHRTRGQALRDSTCRDRRHGAVSLARHLGPAPARPPPACRRHTDGNATAPRPLQADLSRDRCPWTGGDAAGETRHRGRLTGRQELI